MRHMIYTVGNPSDNVLNAGLYSRQYFDANYSDNIPWKFKVILTSCVL